MPSQMQRLLPGFLVFITCLGWWCCPGVAYAKKLTNRRMLQQSYLDFDNRPAGAALTTPWLGGSNSPSKVNRLPATPDSSQFNGQAVAKPWFGASNGGQPGLGPPVTPGSTSQLRPQVVPSGPPNRSVLPSSSKPGLQVAPPGTSITSGTPLDDGSNAFPPNGPDGRLSASNNGNPTASSPTQAVPGMYGDEDINQGPTGAAMFMNGPADDFDALPAGIYARPVGGTANLPAVVGPAGGGGAVFDAGWGSPSNDAVRQARPSSPRSQGQPYVKGNKQSLAPFIEPLGSYPTIKQQPIPVTGAAGTLATGIRKRGNAKSAAQSLAEAYSNGQVDAAAQAVANSALGNGADSAAWADAVTEAAALHPTVAPPLLAKSANLALTTGHADEFAATMADAFATARQKKLVPLFTETVADAIATGGASSRYVFGQAISQAIADGGDSQAAVAEATAAALCSGGDTANAWASAYAVALSKDSSGCLVLNQAKAMAQSKCGNGKTQSFADAQATSLVLGFCGLLDMVNVNQALAGGNSGGSSTSSLSPVYFTSGR